MRWTDIYEIVYELEEVHSDKDNINLLFTDLHKWITELKGFQDDPNKSNEKILESIQMAWIKERT